MIICKYCNDCKGLTINEKGQAQCRTCGLLFELQVVPYHEEVDEKKHRLQLCRECLLPFYVVYDFDFYKCKCGCMTANLKHLDWRSCIQKILALYEEMASHFNHMRRLEGLVKEYEEEAKK